MNVVLIGYRGTGKSTVAQHLALRLGWDWIDADVEVEFKAGKSIAAIFADDGEEAFRDLETLVLEGFLDLDRRVLALGGGSVLRPQNRELLARLGSAVWLQATPATILDRITADASTGSRRPNLTAAGGLAEIEQLLASGRPIYRQCTQLEVDTEGKTPAAVAVEIAERLHLLPPADPRESNPRDTD